MPLQVLDWSPADSLAPVGRVVVVVLGATTDDGRLAELVTACRAKRVPVVFAPRDGVQLPPGLDPRPEEYVVPRPRLSAFLGTELDLVLRGFRAKTVLLVGGLTDVDVHYSGVDAHQLDYHLRTDVDLLRGSSARLHDAALRAMKYLQRDALVSDAAVTAWLDGLDVSGEAP